MEKQKEVVCVEEAMQQFTNVCKEIQPKQLIIDHMGKMMVVAFITGVLSADSVKIRESMIDLIISIIKKAFIFK